MLEHAWRKLRRQDLRRCENFDELFEVVRRTIGPIHGIGALAIYDIAQRIGAHLGLEPEVVYLHRGVVEGARNLGLTTGNGVLEPADLPEAFRRLAPYEIEDCLCIYKDALAKVRRG